MVAYPFLSTSMCSSLFRLRPPNQDEPKPLSFMVLHGEKEGSHGLVESLSRLCCITMAGRYEEFDVRDGRLQNTSAQRALLSSFFSPSTETFIHMLHRNHQSRVPEKGVPPALFTQLRQDLAVEQQSRGRCACSPRRGVLVRASAETVCRLRVQVPLVLVRTDMVLWSLSLARFTVAKEQAGADGIGVKQHPQFDVNGSAHVHPLVYPIRRLDEAAEQVLYRWKEIAATINGLRRCGLSPGILVYEIFEEMQSPPTSLLELLLGDCGEANRTNHCMSLKSDRRVLHRVHDNHIRSYALNANEVIRHFIARRYPSFSDIMQQQHVAGLETLIHS
mmetsp:Transcript_28312/g.59516  ORF Transcript_28312/g.59516 Transcript_28312/m.59516 type:complete len:333 (-) Transcript_28312:169-1167(-)